VSPSRAPPDSRLLQALVFTSGAAVMAVEMTGLRLVAPYFGTSLIVTTILIGSLMTFLALGYRLGGRFGDRSPTLSALARTTAWAAVTVLAIPFLARPILRAAAAVLKPLVEGKTLSEPTVAIAVVGGGMLGTLGLFAIPITLMGMVSPWAARLAVSDLDRTAQTVGRLYALSTFGSILGTFLPALVLIPLLGVRNTFLVIGAVLLAVSALGFATGLRAALPPVAAIGFVLVPQGIVRPTPGLVWEGESLYHFIQVVREPFGKCPQALHLYLNEGIGIHSVKCPEEEQRDIRGVWNYVAAAPLWLDDPHRPLDVLIVGLAGGTVARQLFQAFPDARVDGVEIDGAVIEVGKKWFDDADPRVRPIVMDGRVFLTLTDRTYDVAIIDAYRQPYIPFHLVTREFFELLRAHLREDGVVAVNVASVRGVSKRLAQMIYRTLRETFPTVAIVNATTSNDVIFATTSAKAADRFVTAVEALPLEGDATGLARIKDHVRAKTHAEVDGWQSARVLTDDQAPVEMAWDLMAVQYTH
jgi:predicted O-methyltransferase YrrM